MTTALVWDWLKAAWVASVYPPVEGAVAGAGVTSGAVEGGGVTATVLPLDGEGTGENSGSLVIGAGGGVEGCIGGFAMGAAAVGALTTTGVEVVSGEGGGGVTAIVAAPEGGGTGENSDWLVMGAGGGVEGCIGGFATGAAAVGALTTTGVEVVSDDGGGVTGVAGVSGAAGAEAVAGDCA
jgi:hypothetical protein